ncbi:uncharacterized protein JCM6883_005641 [Sporobolomyces salmoneus]|uniref:uncharacterized protein n=1 Tax=Sporobolomyces salmoneus TaxID=183962 RepID=UPI00317F0E65
MSSQASPTLNLTASVPLDIEPVPITPPPRLTSFLSFSPTPPAPSKRATPLPSPLRPQSKSLEKPVLSKSPASSTFNRLQDDRDDEEAFPLSSSLLSMTAELGSKNPFLAILKAELENQAQAQESSNSNDSTLVSSSDEQDSSSTTTTTTMSTSSSSSSDSPIDSNDGERRKEKKEEVEEWDRIVYDGSLSSGDDERELRRPLHEVALLEGGGDEGDSSQEWEDTSESIPRPFVAGLTQERTAPNKEEERPPTTPILSISPSSPPKPEEEEETPRARPALSSSSKRASFSPRSSQGSRRRGSTILVATSPRQSYRRSPRKHSCSPSSPLPLSISSSRRSSRIDVHGFACHPTSPLLYNTLAPSIPSRQLSSPKKKSKSSSKTKPKPKTPRPRPPPKSLPIDTAALDRFFGVTPSISKARKGGYEGIARTEGLLFSRVESGLEEWKKVEEFRRLLGAADKEEEEEEEEEEEILHIRSPVALETSTRTESNPNSNSYLSPPTPRSSRRRHARQSSSKKQRKPRPPPLKLMHSNNSFEDESTSATSAFSPDTPPDLALLSSSPARHVGLGSPISLDVENFPSPVSSIEAFDPLSREIFFRMTVSQPSTDLQEVVETRRTEEGRGGKTKERVRGLKGKKNVGNRLRKLFM